MPTIYTTQNNLPVPEAPQVNPGVTPAPAIPANPPTFQDIMARLSQRPAINTSQPIAGQATLDKSLEQIQPSSGLRPEIQSVLDMIRKNTEDARSRGTSQAQSLAVKRGIAGSSTEQFGVQQAAEAAERAGRDAETQVLLQNAAREQALQDLRARILAERSGQEATIGAQVGTNQAQLISDLDKALAGLTSDEIASLRNMDAAQQSLALQQLLGQQGIDIARENIAVSRDIAKDAAKNNLLGAGISALAPSLLGGLFGGGGGGGGGAGLFGGGLARLFGGGGGAMTGVGTGTTVPGIGAVGTGAAGGGMGLVPGLGLAAGGIAAYQMLPDKGLLSKSTIAPLVNPLQTAKTVTKAVSSAASSVSKSIKKAFRF